MKLNKKEYSEKGNLPALKKVEMGILNVGKMLRMSSENLYSDPIRTGVQEYLSNARDSVLSVGKNTEAIEIHAPTLSSLFLKIKDYGAGMCDNIIENYFAQFSGSTKDESDDDIGFMQTVYVISYILSS